MHAGQMLQMFCFTLNNDHVNFFSLKWMYNKVIMIFFYVISFLV